MKYRNYKSAIHNFSHSFISIDYGKSGCLAVNILIDLLNKNLETKVTFDFVKKTIFPVEANTLESVELLNDYLDWLPQHFNKHECDLNKLEKFELTIYIEFEKSFVPSGMSNATEFDVNCVTKWKAGKEENVIHVKQNEVINSTFLKLKIPKFN